MYAEVVGTLIFNLFNRRIFPELFIIISTTAKISQAIGAAFQTSKVVHIGFSF